MDNGYAATTALGVQRDAGVSRGALLHHFPTSEALSAAAVARLVEINLQAMSDELAHTAGPGSRGAWGRRALPGQQATFVRGRARTVGRLLTDTAP